MFFTKKRGWQEETFGDDGYVYYGDGLVSDMGHAHVQLVYFKKLTLLIWWKRDGFLNNGAGLFDYPFE